MDVSQQELYITLVVFDDQIPKYSDFGKPSDTCQYTEWGLSVFITVITSRKYWKAVLRWQRLRSLARLGDQLGTNAAGNLMNMDVPTLNTLKG